MMKKYLLIITGLVLIFFLYNISPQYNLKYLNENKQMNKGKLISSKHGQNIFLYQNQIIIKAKNNGKTNTITLPESEFIKVSVLKNKTKGNYPLAGRYIKHGVKLTGKKNTYLVGADPQFSLFYPNPRTKEDKIIIDKSENLLYFYRHGELFNFYQVATGKEPEYTPEGTFKVANKITLPNGYHTEALFGPRWMGLTVPYEKDLRANGKKDLRAPRGHKYGIHGTNEPNSIGTAASGGCIRMHNKEVVKFYELVKTGTPVEIIK